MPKLYVETPGGVKFFKVNADLWVANTLHGQFELTRQNYAWPNDDEEDWGVWDLATDDWAHLPLETGYPTRGEALEAFQRYWDEWQRRRTIAPEQL